MSVFFSKEGKFSIRQNPEPLWNEVKLPDLVGIIWDRDQSNNMILVDHNALEMGDYVFHPEDDLALISEYVDQLIESYWG